MRGCFLPPPPPPHDHAPPLPTTRPTCALSSTRIPTSRHRCREAFPTGRSGPRLHCLRRQSPAGWSPAGGRQLSSPDFHLAARVSRLAPRTWVSHTSDPIVGAHIGGRNGRIGRDPGEGAASTCMQGGLAAWRPKRVIIPPRFGLPACHAASPPLLSRPHGCSGWWGRPSPSRAAIREGAPPPRPHALCCCKPPFSPSLPSLPVWLQPRPRQWRPLPAAAGRRPDGRHLDRGGPIGRMRAHTCPHPPRAPRCVGGGGSSGRTLGG